MPPRDFASGQNPCGGNNLLLINNVKIYQRKNHRVVVVNCKRHSKNLPTIYYLITYVHYSAVFLYFLICNIRVVLILLKSVATFK